MSRGEMRATRVEIKTRDSDISEICAAINAKRRKGTTTAEISIEALRRIHHDHLELIDALRSRKLIAVVLGDDQESLRDLGVAP